MILVRLDGISSYDKYAINCEFLSCWAPPQIKQYKTIFINKYCIQTFSIENYVKFSQRNQIFTMSASYYS